MLFTLHASTLFWSLLLHCGWTYELHETIQTLKEKNLHMQQQLENLLSALRDLEHLLMEYPEESQQGRDDYDSLHAWKDWSQHGIADETHQMLKQALCEKGPHDAAQSVSISSDFLLLSALCSSLLLL